MKKYYPFIIIPFAIVLLVLFVLYNRYSGYYQEEQLDNYVARNVEILNENLDFEKKYALSLSLFISKDQIVADALKTNDQAKALEEIANFLKEIKSTAGIDNVDIQVHTKDLKAFARSWDKSNYFGTDLSGFRKGLVRVKRTLSPSVSIELGKRLNIKAISPILDNSHHFIGSVEAIVGFQNLKNRLHKIGLDIIGLLDKKYITTAVDLKNNPKVGRYYVLEKAYPKSLYNILKTYPEILGEQNRYHQIGDRLIALVPMRSVGIQDVGIIVLSMPTKGAEIEPFNYENIVQENDSYIYKNKNRKVSIK